MEMQKGPFSQLLCICPEELERDFGNPPLVATLRMKRLLDKSQINGSDRNALREFNQQMNMNNEQYLVNVNGI